jgi:hypothetical protein
MTTDQHDISLSDTPEARAPLPILERRRIEAEMLKLVYEVLVERYGASEAEALLSDVIKTSSVKQGQHFAAQEPAQTSMESFIKLYELWTMDGALDISVLRADATHFDFDVKRCRYAEMYKDMGLGKIGHILSCSRDGTFCQGYDPKISLVRTQTIMSGASHCDFRYTYEDADAAGPKP